MCKYEWMQRWAEAGDESQVYFNEWQLRTWDCASKDGTDHGKVKEIITKLILDATEVADHGIAGPAPFLEDIHHCTQTSCSANAGTVYADKH